MNWKTIFKRTILPKTASAKEMADSLLKHTNMVYQKNITDIESIIYKENLPVDIKAWCEWEMIFAWYSMVYLTADMTMSRKKIAKRKEVLDEMAKSYIRFISQCSFGDDVKVKAIYKQAQMRIDAYNKMKEIEDQAGWVGSMSKLLLSIIYICHSSEEDLPSVIDYLAFYLSRQGIDKENDVPRMTASLFLEDHLFLIELFMQFIGQTSEILDIPMEVT